MLEQLYLLMHRHQQPTHDLLDRVSTDGRAGRLSADINGHMNNACYLRHLTHARLKHATATGILQQLQSQQCHQVVTNSEITYIREVLPQQAFRIHTRLLGWDSNYLYYDQRLNIDDSLHTHALLRCVIMQNKQPITPTEFQYWVDTKRHSPALPEYISSWKSLLKDKKRYTLVP